MFEMKTTHLTAEDMGKIQAHVSKTSKRFFLKLLLLLVLLFVFLPLLFDKFSHGGFFNSPLRLHMAVYLPLLFIAWCYLCPSYLYYRGLKSWPKEVNSKYTIEVIFKGKRKLYPKYQSKDVSNEASPIFFSFLQKDNYEHEFLISPYNFSNSLNDMVKKMNIGAKVQLEVEPKLSFVLSITKEEKV